MANMFSRNSSMHVPKTLDDCIYSDSVSKNLWSWAERLERWGKILFFILCGIGILAAIQDGKIVHEYYKEMDLYELALKGITVPSVADAVIDTLFKWALYAAIEYFSCHALALLVGALASITQNTLISTNIALFNAGQACSTPLKDNSPKLPDNWVCPHCGTSNKYISSQCKGCGKYKS